MADRSTEETVSTHLRRQIALSRAAIWAERLARALWPAFAILCAALAGALLGLFEALGPLLHRTALVLAALAFVAAAGLGLRHLRRPTLGEAEARLEAGARSRPISALSDSLAAGEGEATARALWRAHRERAARAASGLRARAPDLRLARQDRWALRLFTPALAIGAAIAAGGLWSDRLQTSLAPLPVDLAGGPAAADVEVEAWAVPPAYTGRDTVYLESGPSEPARLPEGSALTIRVTGLSGATPSLRGEGLTGLEGFRALGDGLHEARAELAQSGSIAVSAGGERLGTLAVSVIPDQPPEITARSRPGPTETRALQVPFAASDDYGVAAAWAEIRLADPGARPMEVEAPGFALPMPISGDPSEVEDTAVADLTTHPWAGAEVLLTLKAEDGAGQVTATDPIRLTLPGRVFTHRLARALVDQRRALVLDLDRADHVLDTVQAVTRRPDEVFGDNAGAYLGVQSAVRRLARAIVAERVADTAPTVSEFLWQAALSLEEGDARNALERLRQAQERLREALESGSQEEIAQAMDDLRQAMNEYLRQLAEQGRQNPQQPNQPQNQERQLSQQDLERIIEQMQRQAESGMRDQAQAMLDQLSQMLENLRPGQQQAGQSEGQQALQQLQDLIERQRGLSDQTFDEMRRRQRGEQGREGEGQRGQGGQQPGQRQGQQGEGRQGGRASPGGSQSGRHGENGRLAAEQEALRQALEGLRGQLGGGEGMRGASRALEGAEEDMGAARDGLEAGRSGQAIEEQMQALDKLNEGAQAMAEALQQQGQGRQSAQGGRTGRGESGSDRRADPFDRPTGTHGAIDGRGTDVPDEALVDRARELLKELRRRAADQTRPPLELDYLERLLERF